MGCNNDCCSFGDDWLDHSVCQSNKVTSPRTSSTGASRRVLLKTGSLYRTFLACHNFKRDCCKNGSPAVVLINFFEKRKLNQDEKKGEN